MPILNVKFERNERSYREDPWGETVVFTVHANTVTDAIKCASELLYSPSDWDCVAVAPDKS